MFRSFELNTTARRAILLLATLPVCATFPLAANAAARVSGPCSSQHNDPIVVHRAFPSGSFGAEREAIANVTVSHEGLVRRVVLAQSSGDKRFDAAALSAVQRTAFAPAARSCVAVDSVFGYKIVSSGGGFATAVMPGSIAVVAERR